jgi:NTE family protein
MSCFGKRPAILVLLVWIFSPGVSTAQDEPRRPVIGLALSGGGSLGLAQIGVLRYLEEHHIPVDVIAGTSMGGLVGGLYSVGHGAVDLENLVKSADWEDLLRTTARYEDRSIAEKQDWNRITGVYSIPLRDGISLPGGINSGQSLVRLLSGETAAYWDVENFDDLPIPFRCVATDLLTGEAFVLRQGHLAEALRATMAIPGIFTPLERDGRILSDGGLVNNLPVGVAKDMGADTIIAVTLRVAAPDGESLKSLPNVVRQTVNIAVRRNEIQQAELADIEIAVPLPNRSSMDFSDTQGFITAGYEAASQNQAALEKLSVSPEQWTAYLENRRSRERSLSELGPLVSVAADQPVIQRNAASELLRKTGYTVSRTRLEGALRGLTAATGLPNAFYGWHSDSEQAGYAVKLESRTANEVVLTPSLFYQFSSGGPSRSAVRLGGTAVLKDAYKSRFLAAALLGSDPGLIFEYYHPFDGSAYFIAPGFAVERTHFYEYAGGTMSDQNRVRISTSLFFGIGTWRQLQLRVGARAGVDRYSSPTMPGGIDVPDTGFVNPEIKGIINTQDSGRLPTRGFRLNAAAGWSHRDRSFPYLEMNFDHFQRIRNQVSLFAMGRADTSMGRDLEFYDQFTAGGLADMDAYRYQEIRGKTLLMAGGGLFYRGLNPRESFFRPIFGSWYQGAHVDPGAASSEFRQSATLGMFMPTPLGLGGATVSVDMSGSVRFRISLGSFWNKP